jgi:pyruvate formate lyase activating enzyme
VCITGGEPTLQKDLIPFIEKVRNLGFSVKLDTNGYNTEIVRKIIEKNLVDYFAIDVKTSFGKYDLVKAPAGAAENVLESIDIITENNISLELRTTVVPGIVTVDDFDDIIRGLNDKDENILPNLARYSVQAFRPQKCLDKNFESVKPYDDSVLEEIAEKLREYVKQVDIMK